MKAVWCNSANWRFAKLFVAGSAGIFVLEISSKRPRSCNNVSQCDVTNQNIGHQSGLQMKNSKLVLNRNFIADAADAASPAVVTIGLRLCREHDCAKMFSDRH